ncbi:hypothetical protein Q2370_27190, partial [Escherichia coli]|nr:hypothetical protein [Escherichia coli]
YYICDDDAGYLDTRGAAHVRKSDAMRAAYGAGYTHAVGSGAYRQGAAIRNQVRFFGWEEAAHKQALAALY